jgi:hypothetical protein
MSNLLFNGEEGSKEQKYVCAVRLTTSFWCDGRGVHMRKSLNFLKRKCEGYNILDEDCSNVGAEEVMPRIVNIDSASDGIYKVVTCNESRDWESGYVDDYDYQLIKMEEDDGTSKG